MNNNEIRLILMNALSLQEVYVSGDSSHYQIIAIGEIFNGMDRIKRQQTVYLPLMEHITNKAIHALSIQTYTLQEWQHNVQLNVDN